MKIYENLQTFPLQPMPKNDFSEAGELKKHISKY